MNLEINMVLYTRDGEKIGNAIIIAKEADNWKVKSDYGNTVVLSFDEIQSLFVPGKVCKDHRHAVKPKETPTNDAVNHPKHYGGEDNPYEAIKVIEAWNLGFCLGNTLKYISRAGKKDAIVQELEKALWYLQREILSTRKKEEGK